MNKINETIGNKITDTRIIDLDDVEAKVGHFVFKHITIRLH